MNEIYSCDRNENEVICVKDLMEAFADKFGFDDRGCYDDKGNWFSSETVLEFISDFADDFGYCD